MPYRKKSYHSIVVPMKLANATFLTSCVRLSRCPSRRADTSPWCPRLPKVWYRRRRATRHNGRPNHSSERPPPASSSAIAPPGEGEGDLTLDRLGGQPGAEVGVDRLEPRGVRRREVAPAGDLGDLAQRLGVGRHEDVADRAELVAHGDLARRACRARSRRSGSSAAAAWRATSSGEMLLCVSLPSDSSTSTDGSRRVPVPSSFGTGVRASSSARWSPVAIAVPPSARRRSSPALTASRSVVGGACTSAKSENVTRPSRNVLGQLVGERARGLDGRGQPVGLDVVGVHRARGVGDHHHRRRALRRGDRALRPRERDHQRGEREQHQQRRQVAAPARPRGHEVGHQRRVGEPGRLAPAPALHRERTRAPRSGSGSGRRA